MNTPADLSAAAILAAEESAVRARRQGEVAAAERLLAWCDLNSIDPQTQPDAVPVSHGGDKLVALGGVGTPGVAELCLAEFAIAAHAGVIATSNRAGDLLDLRHRLPALWDAVRALRVEVWVARKIASMSRKLTRDQVVIVDLAVAEAAEESPARILAIAEAKVIEADLDAHRERILHDAAKKGVWLRRKRPGDRVDELTAEADVQAVTMRLSTAGAESIHETIDQLADLLAAEHTPAHPDDVKTIDQYRAEAAELLADPAAALRLLHGPDPEAEVESVKPKRRPAALVVHLHHDVLSGTCPGVARVEGIGPLLLEQLADLLKHRDLTVLPVIDLQHGASVNGYEHPSACKLRTLLRTTRDVFPHSPRVATARLDHDHPTPYDRNGPPGQTGDHNDAPLARREHRAKTHHGYTARQLGLGAYRWETPHGLARVVTGRGTTSVQVVKARDGTTVGEIYPAGYGSDLLGW